MIAPRQYKGKKIGILGLARTGMAALDALHAVGAEVFAWDDSAERRADAGTALADLRDMDLSVLDALLLAPGIPTTFPAPHPIVERAKAANIPLISDFDVFEAARKALPDHKLVAITGTNGKSTTTALVTHILQKSGRPAAMLGNIGVPILSQEPLAEQGVYVVEASSFQLEITQNFRADIAVLLNISADHLDRHGNMQAYVDAKCRLFALQGEEGAALISDESDDCRSSGLSARAPVWFSTMRVPRGGVGVVDGVVFDALGTERIMVGSLADCPALRGKHNAQNAAAAYGVCRMLGLEPAQIMAGLTSFEGLAHRQEKVAVRSGVEFVNDSKATNVDSAERALSSFHGIFWIAGGRGKGEDYSRLRPMMHHVQKAFFIGEEAEGLYNSLHEFVEAVCCTDLTEAVETAFVAAQAFHSERGEPAVVLLSPACPAFDSYPDFAARGDAFRATVQALPLEARP